MSEHQPLPRKIDQAVLVLFAYDPVIARVIAITEDGLGVAEVLKNTLKVEQEIGQWKVVGEYLAPRRRSMFNRQPEPVFFPTGKCAGKSKEPG